MLNELWRVAFLYLKCGGRVSPSLLAWWEDCYVFRRKLGFPSWRNFKWKSDSSFRIRVMQVFSLDLEKFIVLERLMNNFCVAVDWCCLKGFYLHRLDIVLLNIVFWYIYILRGPWRAPRWQQRITAVTHATVASLEHLKHIKCRAQGDEAKQY